MDLFAHLQARFLIAQINLAAMALENGLNNLGRITVLALPILRKVLEVGVGDVHGVRTVGRDPSLVLGRLGPFGIARLGSSLDCRCPVGVELLLPSLVERAADLFDLGLILWSSGFCWSLGCYWSWLLGNFLNCLGGRSGHPLANSGNLLGFSVVVGHSGLNLSLRQ